MSDAREIISNAIAQARDMDHPNWTSFILQRLTAAGYRILGPGEQTVTEEMVEAAQRIRDVAMRQTIAARLPECGEFGGIAQDADWLVDALKAAMETGHHE